MPSWKKVITSGSDATLNDITLSGDLSIPVAKKLYFGGSNHTYIGEDVDDRLRFFVGGDEFMRFTQQDAGGEIFSIYQDVYIPDSAAIHFGDSNDLKIVHDGSNSVIKADGTGDLSIRQDTADKDILLRCDDGSGGIATYLTLDGSAGFTTVQKLMRFEDDVHARFGTGSDLRIFHDGTDSKIDNYTGTLKIINRNDDEDITLESDDGSGGVTPYIRLDGSASDIKVTQHMQFADNKELRIGNDNDLRLISNNSNTFIDNYLGNMYIRQTVDDGDMFLQCDDGSGGLANYITLDGSAGTVEIGKDTTVSGDVQISNSTPTLNFYDTDDTAIRGFIQWDGTAGVIDSDSTLTLRANNTAGARIQLTNANGITQFYNGSTAYAQLDGGGTDLEIKSLVSNAAFTLRGNDGGSEIDMLAFDVAGGGDARFRQDVIAYYSSDKRLKDNIVRIENPLEKVGKIGGYTFDWNDNQETYTGKDVGVIAQEIQEVLPELVTERDNGYLAVKYEKIVPLLIESIKELKQEIDDIKQKCDCLNN